MNGPFCFMKAQGTGEIFQHLCARESPVPHNTNTCLCPRSALVTGEPTARPEAAPLHHAVPSVALESWPP